jgi:hypothetical protein
VFELVDGGCAVQSCIGPVEAAGQADGGIGVGERVEAVDEDGR